MSDGFLFRRRAITALVFLASAAVSAGDKPDTDAPPISVELGNRF